MAADLHDGPLQIFIGFQMRLELIRKLMAKDMTAATDEIRQLKEICSNQVTEMRNFVRSMRPADEGMSLGASLSRLAELFQKDTGVEVNFSAGEIRDPAQNEISLELLQLVREALTNIHKHSGATRVAMTAARRDNRLEITIEDNGSGFPFAGNFSLDELDALRIGPVSIKRRIRTIRGDLSLDSEPGHGAKIEMRIPM